MMRPPPFHDSIVETLDLVALVQRGLVVLIMCLVILALIASIGMYGWFAKAIASDCTLVGSRSQVGGESLLLQSTETKLPSEQIAEQDKCDVDSLSSPLL